jgi:hypothetical protein
LRGKEDIQFTPGAGELDTKAASIPKIFFSNVEHELNLETMQLAVNTQIHPATFGGIANCDYIRKLRYAQGISDSNFQPFPY